MSVCLSVRQSVIHPSVHFLFPEDNLSKHQWIFTKLGMCIDIMEIWFGIANGQFSSIFFAELSAHDTIMAGYYSLTFLFVMFLMDLLHFRRRIKKCLRKAQSQASYPVLQHVLFVGVLSWLFWWLLYKKWLIISSKRWLSLKKRIWSQGGKIFPLRDVPFEKGDKYFQTSDLSLICISGYNWYVSLGNG